MDRKVWISVEQTDGKMLAFDLSLLEVIETIEIGKSIRLSISGHATVYANGTVEDFIQKLPHS